MPSIYRRSNGYWVYQRYVLNPITGNIDKRYYQSLGNKIAKNEIPDLLISCEEDYFRKQHLLTQSLSKCIKTYIEKKETEVKQSRRAVNTLRTDRNSLNLFSRYILGNWGDMDISEITRKFIISWREARFAEGVSNSTVAVNMRTVKAFFSYFVNAERLEGNPFIHVKIPKTEINDSDSIKHNYNDVFEFIETQVNKRRTGKSKPRKRQPNNKKDDFDWFYDNDWFIHYIWIMLNTGMRSGEVSLLKWKKGKKDIGKDHSRSYVYISKNPDELVIYFKRSMRKLKIFEPVKHSLKLLSQKKKDGTVKTYLFERDDCKKPHDTSTVGRLFKKLLKKLELDDEQSPHSLRHGYGSFLLNNQVSIYEVSKILGHTSVEVTERIYAHSDSEDLAHGMSVLYEKKGIDISNE
jgi:site-specific recombinase XerD